MNRQDWQSAFGDVPEDFHRRLCAALDGLEDGKMKKRFKFSTMLAAALIAALLITGAAVAATRLGILDHMNRYENAIVPLDGAEALVATDMGSAENEYATLTVEEALYDGQGVMLQLRIAPKDPEHDAIFSDDDREAYDFDEHPVPVAQNDSLGWYRDDGTWDEVETYEADGVRYYTDMYVEEVLGRKDGRRIIYSDFDFDIDGGEYSELMPSSSWDEETQPDGSVRIWMEADAEVPLPNRQIAMKVIGRTWTDAEALVPFDDIEFTLAADEDERRALLEPVGDGKGERCQVTGGEVLFTKIRGYVTVDYLVEPIEGEDRDTTISIVDADGQPIATGGGWQDNPEIVDGVQHCRAHWQIQSYDALPETIWFEVRADDAPEVSLGRIECRVEEVD